MLPRLAEIFGTTTDALLGIAREDSVREATVEPEPPEQIQFRKGNWEFKYENSRRGGIIFACFVLFVGILYLVSSILQWEIGLWDIIWPCALLFTGINGLYPKFSFVGLGLTLFGGYFLVNQFLPIQIQPDNGVIVAVVILLLGGAILMDALKKPKKPRYQFTIHNDHGSSDKTPRNDFHIDGTTFRYDAAFGDHDQAVTMPLLSNGMVNTSFGDFELDLSGVTAVDQNCYIEANTSFGDLTILVPSKFQVRCSSSAAFADLEITGKPDTVPQGIIQLNANVSFGHITVEYV